MLTPLQYNVVVNKDTERPFTGEYNDHFPKTGFYKCVACNARLFESTRKFKTHCGWPAFSESVADSIDRIKDLSHGMQRVEVVCSNCGGHLGHVFNDGSPPTGIRYCINSASLVYDAGTN